MQDLLLFLTAGFAVGCVYALMATGLVLTYKTSGVFNLAFGAQAFVSAAIFYDLEVRHGWPLLPAFLVSVVVVGPLLGLLLDRALFRHMRTASWQVKLVSALGLMLAIPEIVKLWFGTQPQANPPNLAPLIGLDAERVFTLGDYTLSAERVVTIVVTLVVIGGLVALFRFTALGLRMRAVVESPRMVELSGIDAERVSASAWMLSSFLAALAGVLVAPLFNFVDGNQFLLLIVAAIAAAAFGRLSSIPLTFLGGIVLGVAQQLLAGYLPTNSILAAGLRPALPFVMLFLLLLFWPGLRTRREAADPLAGVDPPPPAPAATYKDARLRRISRVLFPVFLAVFVGLNLFVLSDLWVRRFTDGLVLTVILLSITVFMGLGGQISLGQVAFVGAGAFTTAQLATNHGVDVILAMLIGAALAAIIGFLLAIPALRLGGIFLTLATLAFALMAEAVVFPLEQVSEGPAGIRVPRPQGLDGDQGFFLFTFAVFAVVATVVILVRNGTTGRFLAALRGSEIAAASIGINATRQRIVVFTLSAAIAGLAGGLSASFNGRADVLEFPALFGVFYVVLIATVGARTIDGAVNAAMGFVLINYLLVEALKLPAGWQFILFGFGAITFAKHPEGVVELRTRESIEATLKSRDLAERARRLAAVGRAPEGYRPAGFQVLLTVATAGLWSLVWCYRSYAQVHRARHGRGVSGSLGLLANIVPPVVLTFFLLPMQVEALYGEHGRLSPIVRNHGIVPTFFVGFLAYLLSRRGGDSAPTAFGLGFVCVVTVVIYLQWLSRVQAALNEYAVLAAEGAFDETASPADRPTGAPAVPTVAQPAGGT